nr:proteasome-associated protein ECM29 homolog isoform X1 [Onthophagus taurus]
MTSAQDELVLLERVFLRVGSAETDEQLQNVVSKFLPPVLLKLASPEDAVRKKVMELLIHINKRIKTRPQVRLPVSTLLSQYQNPEASSFLINFTIIYIKMGFPRLTVEEQTDLVPNILNSLDGKPQAHQDSLLLLIVPLLGKIKIPSDPSKRSSIFGLNEKPQICKHLLGLLLDVILLPYGSLSLSSTEHQNPENESSVPAGMSEYTYKRVLNENPLKPDELEQIKLGIIKFLANDIFPNEDILIHMIVAAADTRFSIPNLADNELKKIIGVVDWNSSSTTMPLFMLFLGTQSHNVKSNLKKAPASTRIRLKILTYLCRVTNGGFVVPISIQVIFDSLFGIETNSKLKTLALNFTANLVRYADGDQLKKVAPVLQTGLNKLINEGEQSHQGQAFTINGMIGRRFPMVVYHDVSLLEMFFKKLESADQDLKLQIREGLLNLISAYKYDVNPEECDKNGRMNILFVLLKYFMESEEAMVRFATVRTLATIFPPEHVPSKALLLLAMGDSKDEVSTEAMKSLYGTSRKTDIDISKGSKIKVVMPSFSELVLHVYKESEDRMKDPSKQYSVGNRFLPFATPVFTEMIMYLRLCLIQDLEVPLTRNIIKHPCETTPIIKKHLQSMFKETDEIENSALLQYVSLVKQLMMANPSVESICCMSEIIGCVPNLYKSLSNDINWLRDLLNSVKEEVREQVALLYAVTINPALNDDDFNKALEYLIKQTNSKNLESQHGALLAIGNCLERRIMTQKEKRNVQQWEVFKTCVNTLVTFLSHQNGMLMGGACTAIGLIAKSTALPLENGGIKPTGSPEAKKLATAERITKCDVVSQLLVVMNNNKNSSKARERAALALGLLCVGEDFPFVKEVIQGFLDTAKETKDVEVHFTIGESLVMCVQGLWSSEARDSWTILPDDYTPQDTMRDQPSDENLEDLLTSLLNNARSTHPNARQASCIWLLALLKSCPDREPIKNQLSSIQSIFMNLLGENNDIVQDVSSKGLCLVYDYSKSEELLSALVDQLTSGRRSTTNVTASTKLFEEGELGKSPTGGNLSTYKELCSLASDLNKPDLVYQFMHIANHNAIWNSKKGAAFGFSSIAEKCGERLQAYLPQIVPKLYRYQYDPTPNLQGSMQNIWHVLVPEPQKMLDTYHHEILADLLANLNSPQYRVRQSCCLALQDFIKGAGNRSIHDSVDSMEEIWTQLFRVMDDHHEATRLAANKTAKVLSKLCIRGCDKSQGKDGVKMTQSILPVFLNKGITNTVAEVRLISLQTISELVGSAGPQLKPFLPQLIPALLQATGELESSQLSRLSTMLGGQSHAQEAVDSARASFAKSHFTTETVSKCLQYADATILEELVPKVVDLMKGSVVLGTRVACAHFITLLVVQLGNDLQPYTGKFLSTLVNGLTDRNAAIRKHYATTIGHLVKTAKESSLEKLFAKINHWYFEREDDTIRSACAHTIKSIGVHNQDILKAHSDVILPLVFFAMHAENNPETENTIETWNEIWSEHSPGTESGIRQNIEVICETLKTALDSPSWNMKAQAANSISTVAAKLGLSMERKHRNTLIEILLAGLSGRTWNGKDKLLKALASICKNCKDSLKIDPEVDLNNIVEAVLKECRKEDIEYKVNALSSLGDILSSLEIDRFEDVYNIVHGVLNNDSIEKEGDEEETSKEEQSKKREIVIKLKEVAFECLGKAWPEKSKQTQEKYREILIENCVDCLPVNTRSVQVCIVVALCNYVDKLQLLNEEKLNETDKASLSRIINHILVALTYSLGIAKNTRLRKEALNVIYSLGKKLKQNDKEEFEKLVEMFETSYSELCKDNQPEIKSRVIDIKKILIDD